MKSSSKMMFFSTMLISTILILNSSSWISMWVGLEINLMSFIPLMYNHKNSFLSQNVMMYFLVQSLASMLFIMSILINKYLNLQMNWMIKLIIISSMMMKMGMPPFHSWFPEVMNKMNWNMCLLLMTWQKMAPMYTISLIIEANKTMATLICMSTFMGAVGGLNHTSTRKIMAYSSMNHMGWMMACAMMFKKSWIIYMLMYSMLMLMSTKIMHLYNILYINQMNMFLTKNMDKLLIVFLMLSIGGFPPFLGFLPKWIAIQYMISYKEIIMMIMMIMASMITLSYYLKISTMMNMLTSHSQKWLTLSTTMKTTSSMLFMINMTLPLCILLLNMY